MTGSPFDAEDLRFLERRGISLAEAERQLALFADPPPPTRLVRPATLGDGIHPLDVDEPELRRAFADATRAGRWRKFVPASGAASRMFKSLTRALEERDADAPDVARLVAERSAFAFAEELPATDDPLELVAAVLGEPGLGLAQRPKGLIPFHRDAQGQPRTAFEEHLAEAAELADGDAGLDGGEPVRLHFTVSPEHRNGFEARLAAVRGELEERHGVTFDVELSEQSPATDTLAVDPAGEPFRLDDGSLVLRPGGHGALIDNLQLLAEHGAELLLIKNIDNVQPGPRRRRSVPVLRALLGRLAQLEERVHGLCRRLRRVEGEALESLLPEAVALLDGELGRPNAPRLLAVGAEAARDRVLDLLDRPLRVCGMVRNEGEPGGGPFWVADPDHGESLQIVETSQIDLEDPAQAELHRASTHFNPVLLACSLRDSRGQAHDLHHFVDPRTSFIAEKSLDGRPLRALERPGLWNGAMAGWNTVFVEVPIVAFSPVKTLFDLLRPEHRGSGDGDEAIARR